MLPFAAVILVLSPYSPAPQTGVRVAVSPAVHGSLDQAALLPQRLIELRQGPADPVTLCFVREAVARIILLFTKSARIDAIGVLELFAQSVGVNSLDIASDPILHLDTISRILERDDLHPVICLLHHHRRRGRDRSWSRRRATWGGRPIL